jgi:hypothetical protein
MAEVTYHMAVVSSLSAFLAQFRLAAGYEFIDPVRTESWLYSSRLDN